MDDGVVVLDFETTGLSPDYGDRAIEIGAVLIREGRIVDRFQRLMNPGRRVPAFIEQYTGITNRMLADAPSCAEAMAAFDAFLCDHAWVAHNAGFDRRFLDAELGRIGRPLRTTFTCSMLLARRLYPDAPCHKLEELVRYRRLKTDGVFHRALADAEMTGQLWLAMGEDLRTVHGLPDVSFDLLSRIARTSKAAVPALIGRLACNGKRV